MSSHGATPRSKMRPETRERSTVLGTQVRTPASSTSSASTARGGLVTTTRAVPCVRRASTSVPSRVSERRTVGAAGSSRLTSVRRVAWRETIGRLMLGAGGGAGDCGGGGTVGAVAAGGAGSAAWRGDAGAGLSAPADAGADATVAVTSAVSSRTRSWWPVPSSRRRPRTTGAGPVTSMTRSCASAIATMRRPSVLTMSGSSTPVSWTFVLEKGTASRPGPAAGAAAAGGGAVTSAKARDGGAVSTWGGGGSARVGTPVPPPKRPAFVRA